MADPSILRHTLTLAAMSGLLLLSSQAAANSIGIGIARTAEFSGSDDYEFTPIAEFEWETPVGILKNEQIGAQLDLVKSGSWDTGPIVRINPGRDDSVSDEVIAQLPEIEVSPEAGWFIGSGIQLKRLGLDTDAIVIGRLSVVSDIGDTHGGTQVNGSIGLVLQVNETLRFVPSVSLNYADESYTQAFYGVDGSSAESSGLSQFAASGGLESTQLGLLVIRKLDDKWSVKGRATYTALQGDAESSPITQRGSDTQIFTGVVASYQF